MGLPDPGETPDRVRAGPGADPSQDSTPVRGVLALKCRLRPGTPRGRPDLIGALIPQRGYVGRSSRQPYTAPGGGRGRCDHSGARNAPAQVGRWGGEGAGGLGRHTAMYLVGRGHDVRDVCPTRTAERARRRRQGKTDALDSVRIARETQADTKDVRTRLNALPRRDRTQAWDPSTALRLRLLEDHAAANGALDDKDKEATKELGKLIERVGSTLGGLCGLAEKSVAELLVEAGDPRRFASEGGFARFNGTAPLPASSGEGDGRPVRHRLNRGGNRRVNAVLHRMAVTQLRCEPRARKVFDDARHRGHTKKEAMRILKRHLSDVVYRRMVRDLKPDHEVSAEAA